VSTPEGRMSEQHLHPNRAWILIRDGGQFSPQEVDHLQKCEQCSEWISMFADLARNAGFKLQFNESFFFIAEDQHMTAGRAWSLIRDKGQLTMPETGHLYYCKVCNGWLTGFVAAARSAGFKISFEVPPCDSPREE
jgi:hypothetical protein